DPAIERWGAMRTDVYKHFRFTPKTTIQSIVGMIVIPGALFYLAYDQDWSWAGKLKSETLYRVPPPAPESEE
ncbi:uncharacterized protein LAESUDRAFT_659799, partial [Laetiporus sulphureus 93-53]